MSTIELSTHGIPRAEWVRRFKERIKTRLGLNDDDDNETIAAAELESWPLIDEHPVAGMPNDWELTGPEEAADENLSNWTD
jgi:hypothetical protein